jgi:aminopeptidase
MTAPVAALPLVRLHRRSTPMRLAPALVTPYPWRRSRWHAVALSATRRDASFDRAASWLYEGMAKAFCRQHGAAGHRGRQPDAAVRRGPGQGRARQSSANSIAYQPALEKIAGFDINWNIVAYPGHEHGRSRSFPAGRPEADGGGACWRMRSSRRARVDRDERGGGLEGSQRRSFMPNARTG